MRIVGVIDLRNGLAVHARGGRRPEYLPVSTAAGAAINGDAIKLATIYRDTLGLADVYIADLDAIAEAPSNDDVIRAISGLGVNVLVDGGIATREDAQRVAATGADEVIVGLETLASFEALRAICSHDPVVFSLDLRNRVPIHDATLPDASPEDFARQAVAAGARAVIVLDMARVGGTSGPDVEMLARIRRVIPASVLLAGGGVRGPADLRVLSDVGCDGALVASALHDGRLTRSDVAHPSRIAPN